MAPTGFNMHLRTRATQFHLLATYSCFLEAQTTHVGWATTCSKLGCRK